MKKKSEIEDRDKINQIYREILCNIIRKQNIYLLEKICKKYNLSDKILIKKFIIRKIDVRNILTSYFS